MRYERAANVALAVFLVWVLGMGAWHELSAPLCSVGVATDAMAGDKKTWCFEFWLNRYQTLASGILAVAAASVSVYFLRRQIAQDGKHEQERYAREHAAARAVLQLTLSDICEYASASILELKQLLTALRDERVVGAPIPFDHPAVPDQPIEQLYNFIASTDADRTHIVAELIHEMQVHSSRMRSIGPQFIPNEEHDEIIMQHQIAEYIVDAAEIYARASMLFSYARRQAEIFPQKPNKSDINNALFVIDYPLQHEENIKRLVEGRYLTD